MQAAAQSLEKSNVNLILPFVPKTAEAELADRLFFETAVRLHRAGEGAPYTGLKPAGLDVGPVIPVAERAIESGSADELIELLSRVLREEVGSRFQRVMHLKDGAARTVDQAREYVSAMLGLEVYAHRLYQSLKSTPHEGHSHHVKE